MIMFVDIMMSKSHITNIQKDVILRRCVVYRNMMNCRGYLKVKRNVLDKNMQFQRTY